MKKVTLSANGDLIERARQVARGQRKTLNTVFREWLVQFTAGEGNRQNYRELMKSMRHVNAGRHFTRDEMNQR